jgi:hypothetical protein
MLKGPILKILNRDYQPEAMVELKSGRYDLAFKTDHKGRPILLFIGIKGPSGRIKGDRYARRIVENKSGEIIKDHWDHKGPASAN